MRMMSASSKKEKRVRLGLGTFFALLLAVSLLPLVSAVSNIGVFVPAAVSACGLAGCVYWPVLRRILAYIWERKGPRIVLIVLLSLAAALLALFLAVSGIMLVSAARPAPENATVIVLGAAIREDRPCRMLADRLNAAARYLEENPDSSCIVSGGQGADEAYTEASVMKAYLMEKGVAESRVYMEDTSTNTFENMRNSQSLIEEHGLNTTVVIATQEFHQYRAQSFAEKGGAAQAGPCTCRTPAHLLLCYWVREFAAICRMWIAGY